MQEERAITELKRKSYPISKEQYIRELENIIRITCHRNTGVPAVEGS
jgi:hypothetical protein